MQKLIFPFLLLFLFACASPKKEVPQETTETETFDRPEYDPVLAEKLGADEYGMGQYVMAFLKSGPTPSPDSTTRADLQKAHMANIRRLADEGTLLLAGPFMDNGELRGIYIFDVKTIEEAKKLTATDPAIQSGALVMELHPWYVSAGVRQIGEIHDKVMKTAF